MPLAPDASAGAVALAQALRARGLGEAAGDIARVSETVLAPYLARHDPDEEELAANVRRLALQALAEGSEILDKGRPDMKLRLITAIFGRLVNLIGEEDPRAFDNMKTDMDRILREIGARG